MTDDAFLQFLCLTKSHLCQIKQINIMKRNITILSAALVSSLIISCKKEVTETTETSTQPETKTYSELEKANWFLGNWGNTSAEGELTESWKKENDSVYTSATYFVVGGKDTVFAETARLEETNGKLAYIVTVPSQNESKPVRFDMTSSTESQIVFENPQHDYPTKIVYTKTANDSLVAEISGMQKGKPASEKFAMKKQ